jgi:aconitase A
MQDFTGVPCVVDLAAMRDAMNARSAATRRRSTRWSPSTSSSITR